MDLEDLADDAVLAVGAQARASSSCRLSWRIRWWAASGWGRVFCAPTTKMTLGGAPGVGVELAAGRRGDDDQSSVAGDGVDAAQGVIGWPPMAFISCAWVAKSSANLSLRADSARSAVVDRVRDAGLLKRHRGVGSEITDASLSRLSHLIKRLESRDLVRREGDPDYGPLHQRRPDAGWVGPPRRQCTRPPRQRLRADD